MTDSSNKHLEEHARDAAETYSSNQTPCLTTTCPHPHTLMTRQNELGVCRTTWRIATDEHDRHYRTMPSTRQLAYVPSALNTAAGKTGVLTVGTIPRQPYVTSTLSTRTGEAVVLLSRHPHPREMLHRLTFHFSLCRHGQVEHMLAVETSCGDKHKHRMN